MPDIRYFPRPHFDVLTRDARAPHLDLFEAPTQASASAHDSEEIHVMEDPLQFPRLEDFSEYVLDVRPDSPCASCYALGNYRLVQATHLIQRIRDESDYCEYSHRAVRQEKLLSGLEALLLDAYLMFRRSGLAEPEERRGEPPYDCGEEHPVYR
ncbi:hypothetical protein LJR232_003373 [Aquipseudomonas alcaligenes]